MKRTIVTAICAALVIILLVCILPFPQRINKTLSGISWQDGSTVSSGAELSISGRYCHCLLRQNYFTGTITYNGKEMEIEKAVLHDMYEGSKCASLTFYDPDKNQIDSFGPIYILGAFDKVLVDNSTGTPPELQSFPAATRDEALGIALELTGYNYS